MMLEQGRLGENLIFLISQPRSGSTLLQHILAGHSQVHTLPEPWFMLHLAYGLRPTGLEAEYNAKYALLALREFLERIPGGDDAYLEGLRAMALRLYGGALEGSGKTYFLDKTPRYYFVIPELVRVFPEAKYILLVRNPLAVFSSILDVNFRGDVARFREVDRRHDILSAPRLLLDGAERLGDRAAVVRYEELVSDPAGAIRGVCTRVGLAFEDGMLKYGDKVRFEGTSWVDPKSIYQHDRPVADYRDGWWERFDTTQKTHLGRAYLQALGQNTVEALGYSYGALMDRLEGLKVTRSPVIVPWSLLMTPAQELSWGQRCRLRLGRRCWQVRLLLSRLLHRGFGGKATR